MKAIHLILIPSFAIACQVRHEAVHVGPEPMRPGVVTCPLSSEQEGSHETTPAVADSTPGACDEFQDRWKVRFLRVPKGTGCVLAGSYSLESYCAAMRVLESVEETQGIQVVTSEEESRNPIKTTGYAALGRASILNPRGGARDNNSNGHDLVVFLGFRGRDWGASLEAVGEMRPGPELRWYSI